MLRGLSKRRQTDIASPFDATIIIASYDDTPTLPTVATPKFNYTDHV